VALVGVGLLVAVVSCGRNQPDYEERANEALDQANLSEVDADYDNSSGVVHVKGSVQSEDERQRAGEIVQKAVSDGAQVANEVTVAGGHRETADDFDGALETRLANLVDLDPTLKDRDIGFDAENGIVTITGRVPTAAEKDRRG
jgi:osmotically-inducible protein OsmY